MATAAAYAYVTPEDYLAFEREAEIKHEYCNGQLYAMSGATRAHNLITGNMFVALHTQLKGRTCEVYTGEMRVLVDAARSYAYRYPDVVVACEEPRFEDDVFDTLLNPTVIVEVLSPSTAARDRGEKFEDYGQLASLHEYVLVAQKEVCVEHYLRQGSQWVSHEYRELDAVLRLMSIHCALPLREIYERVKL